MKRFTLRYTKHYVEGDSKGCKQKCSDTFKSRADAITMLRCLRGARISEVVSLNDEDGYGVRRTDEYIIEDVSITDGVFRETEYEAWGKLYED